MPSDAADEIGPIILDNGSGTLKAGFAGEDAPRVVIPNMIGYPRHTSTLSDTSPKEQYIGNEALARKEILSIRYPMDHGIVTNWDDMEKIWHHTFHNELRITPEEHPILLTQAPFNPMGNREKAAQILFEHFQVPAMHIHHQGALTLYTSGRCIAAVSLDIGDGVTHTLPITEGHISPLAMNRLDYGDRDLTNWMVKLLVERGYSFTSTAEREIVRDIKEKFSYVALDFEKELVSASRSKTIEKAYELPDGQQITIGNECFRCAEALFQPFMMGQHEPSVAELLNDALMKSDPDVQSHLYDNIILCGGTTLIPGFDKRLKKEMEALALPGRNIRLVVHPEREFFVWIGGSILASLSKFTTMWISKQEYDESGPSIMHRCHGHVP